MRTLTIVIALLVFIVIMSSGVLHTFNRTRVYEAVTRVNLVNPEARIIDRAMPPSNDDPIHPKVAASLAVFFAVACGFSLVCVALGFVLAPAARSNQSTDPRAA